MRTIFRIEYGLLLALIAVVLVSFACRREEPLPIGYAANLSGRISELGLSGYNGTQMAIEEINRQGGVHGRPVQLTSRDNEGSPERAVQVTRELIAAGCPVIIGHLLSSMSVAAVPALAGGDTVMLSPTTSTSELSGHDDQFFRLYPDLRELARRLARHAFQERGVRRMALIGDSANQAFSEPWHAYFTRYFEDLGGHVVAREMFSSAGQEALYDTVSRLLVHTPDGLLVIASAPDTGMICQQLHKLDGHIPVFASEWSFAGALIRYGGQAVEGLTLFHNFDRASETPAYVAFAETYRGLFRKEPDFAAVNAYDATRLALSALQQQRPGESLKQALLRQGPFRGLQVEMRLDPFGEVVRPLFLTRIIGGRFQRIDAP